MDTGGVMRLRCAILGLARRLDTPSIQEGLSPAQASVLAVIVSRGPLGVSELSAIEGLDPARVSGVVSNLETFGLVRREPDPGDDRGVRVEGTPAGEATWRLIGAEQAELIAELLACLSVPEQRILAAAMPALGQLAEGLRPAAGQRLSAGGLVT
jgi:DNA-binding MarR family transcriptional regulator